MGGMREVGNVERGWIPASTRAANDEYWNVLLAAFRDEQAFLRDAVDGVEHIVEACLENLIRVGLGEEGVERMDGASGIDGTNPPSHRLGLRLADGAVERVE